MHQNRSDKRLKYISISDISAVNRLTALWAFSESALGGVLHAFRIPFSGLFICGAAVIFISLIAKFSEKRWEIFRSTLIVVLVKIIISPNTPLNAHLAVLLQGLAGQILFMTKRFPGMSSLFLGIFAASYSAVQKVIVLTLVFGFTLWESLDQFGESVMKIFFPHSTGIRISLLIIGIYSAIHLAGGIAAGIIAGRLPVWIDSSFPKNKRAVYNFNLLQANDARKNKNKRNRKWWKRPTGIFIVIFSVVFALLTYFFPFFGKNKIADVTIMIIRSVLIVFLWFTFVAPFLLKLFRKFIDRKRNIYTDEINSIIFLFPQLRYLVKESWKNSKSLKGIKRLKHFIVFTFILLIFAEPEAKQKSNLLNAVK